MADNSGVQTYFLQDGLGSTTALTDDGGAMTATYQYDAFGALKTKTGTGDTVYKFTGELQDAESGLYYLRARYYDPALGRFLSRDPLAGLIGLPQSLNQYVYALNNPVNLIDPAGLQAPAAAGTVVLICGAASGGTCTVAIGVGILGTVAVGACVATECYEVIGDAVGSGMEVVVQGAGNLASEGWQRATDPADTLGDIGEMLGVVKKPKPPKVINQPFPRSDMVEPWYPSGPGEIFPPGLQPPNKGIYKLMFWTLVGGTAADVSNRLGIWDLIDALWDDKE